MPPKNRPNAEELNNCRSWLVQELALLPQVQAVLALGKIAFDGYLRALRELGMISPALPSRTARRTPSLPVCPASMPPTTSAARIRTPAV